MKIGFPNHPRKDVLKEIEWIGRNGFDFVDLFLEEDRAVPEKIDVERVKKLLNKYKLGIVGHTGWYLPVGSPVRSFRDAALSEAKNCFDVFSRLDVKYVTIHANWPPKLFSTSEGINFQAGTLKRLIKEADKHGLDLIYEPIDTPKDTLENVADILNKVPGLYFHLDIGHANLHGRTPEEFIKKFHRKLKHVHLSDNDGIKDLHVSIGEGNINWEDVIGTLKQYYDGTITLEIFSLDRNLVLMSRDNLRKMWNSC